MPFSEIKGQDSAISLLRSYIELKRLGGAYIFTGPSSVGKKLTAKIFSQALNCEKNNSEACGKCPSCLKIENNQHPDVHFISCEGNSVKIEDIRRLQKEASLKSYEGSFKVFIIDDAHNLTPEASNCLLKILEEPAAGTLIILVTDKINLVFKTIVSRCRLVKFRSINREELEDYLRIKYSLDEDSSHFLAFFTEGKFGRAQELRKGNVLLMKNSIIDRFVFTSAGASDININERKDFQFVLNVLACWFRDVYMMKAGSPRGSLINSDRLDELKESAGKLSFSNIEKALNVVSNTAFYLERNINSKLLLHNLRAQICQS